MLYFFFITTMSIQTSLRVFQLIFRDPEINN
jgi:hypothetical protein